LANYQIRPKFRLEHDQTISRKGLYFYIMQLPIRPNCSD